MAIARETARRIRSWNGYVCWQPADLGSTRVEDIARETHLAEFQARPRHDLAQKLVAPLGVSVRAAVDGRIKKRFVLLDGSGCSCDELAARQLPLAEAGECCDPTRVVGNGSEDAIGRSIGGRVKLTFEQTHPKRKIDKVVAVQVGGESVLKAIARCFQVTAHECPPNHELDSLGRLMLVARRSGIGPFERSLGRLQCAESIENASETSLDASPRIGVLGIAGLHENL